MIFSPGDLGTCSLGGREEKSLVYFLSFYSISDDVAFLGYTGLNAWIGESARVWAVMKMVVGMNGSYECDKLMKYSLLNKITPLVWACFTSKFLRKHLDLVIIWMLSSCVCSFDCVSYFCDGQRRNSEKSFYYIECFFFRESFLFLDFFFVQSLIKRINWVNVSTFYFSNWSRKSRYNTVSHCF